MPPARRACLRNPSLGSHCKVYNCALVTVRQIKKHSPWHAQTSTLVERIGGNATVETLDVFPMLLLFSIVIHTGGRIRHRYNSWTPFLLMKLHWRLVFALSPSSRVCPNINVNQIISAISVVCWTCIMFVVTVKVVIQSVVAVCCNVPAARSKSMIANTRYRMLLRLRRPIYFRVLLLRQSCCRGVDLLVRFWNKSF